MSSIIRASRDDTTNISVPQHVKRKISAPCRKKWCSAFVLIYCARAFKDVLTSRENKNETSPGGSSDRFVIEIVKDYTCFYDINQPTLAKLVKEKDLEKLNEFRGVEGIAASLNSNVHRGINGEDAEDILRRSEVFGKNTYDHRPPRKGFFHFVWENFKDPTIATLLACATAALGFGIKERGRKEGWHDGGSMFVAVFLVICVSAISNMKQSRLFDRFSKFSQNNHIEVVRNGTQQQIRLHGIVVGDVACLKIGDHVPADGLFVGGHSLRVDESSITGEGDPVEINHSKNPFMISGTKVADGYARMLVTAVGMNSTLGETMASDSLDSADKTPLQDQLNKLSSFMSIVGAVLALPAAAVVCYSTGNKKYKSRQNESGSVVVEFIATVVNTAVVAIPGGLPNHGYRGHGSKVICLGNYEFRYRYMHRHNWYTLTQSKMTVAKFWLGKESVAKESYTSIVPSVLDLLHQAASLNKTANVLREKEAFSGIPIGNAILRWVSLEHILEMEQVKQNCSILQVEEFSEENRRSGVLIKKNVDNTFHVHWMGAAEMILEMCSHYYDRDGDVRVVEDSDRWEFIQIIQVMEASSLRCTALAHKQILEANADDGGIKQEFPENNLILLGIVGLKDPCKQVVKDCQDAGVNIKMITSDNILKAKALAIECGLLGFNHDLNDGSVVEGAEFRDYTDGERMEKVDKIVVIAGSSPYDKHLMVKCLKDKGHVVAVTGDETNDAPALKEADIGLLMGVQDTKASKECADIIIFNNNFSSVVRVLRWGRCIYKNIQKFTQFQIAANISGLLINFFTAILAGKVPLTALKALWVSLITNPLGALALVTERPAKAQMKKPPGVRPQPLITNIMWRNLLGQGLYQTAVVLLLQFKGESIFGVSQKVNDTLVYNTFVLCQVFNQFNARRLERKNVFEGILGNQLFLGIVGLTMALQVVMVELLKRVADTEQLCWGQWAACAGIASASWPIGLLIKYIPIPQKPFQI